MNEERVAVAIGVLVAPVFLAAAAWLWWRHQWKECDRVLAELRNLS